MPGVTLTPNTALGTPGLSRQNTRFSQLGPSRQGTQISLGSRSQDKKSHKNKRQLTDTNISLKSTGSGPKPLSIKEQKQLEDELKTFRSKSNIRQGFRGKVFFRRAIRIIVILQQWVSCILEKEDDLPKGAEKVTSFADFATQLNQQRLANSDISFDPDFYKAKKEIIITKEVQNILNLPKQLREPHHIDKVLRGLQHLRSFAEYPRHMQEKLCQVAWYQCISPQRVIIRQGHYAENFYFILSGHAMVTILEKDEDTGYSKLKTAAILRRGQSFGELSLLHHTLRKVTVVSQDTVQLLSVGRDDFFRIFMSAGKPGELPDHIKFISQLDFMKSWPIEKLADEPDYCLMHFFKRGVAIEEDSNNSEWIYVVKSGSCQVLKKIEDNRNKKKRRSKTVEDVSCQLPKLGAGEQPPKIVTGIKRTRSLPVPTELKATISEFENKLRSGESVLPAIETKALVSGDPPPKPGQKNVAGYSKSKYNKFPQTKRPHFTSSPHQEPPAKKDTQPEIKVEPPKEEEKPKKKQTLAQKIAELQWNSLMKQLSTPENTSLLLAEKEKEKPKPKSVFVQVDMLHPGDIFGLNGIRFDLDVQVTLPSVSLVSRGAECIMLSKAFFTRYANDEVKQIVRSLVRPYPSERELQKNLQSKKDWATYKNTLVVDLTNKTKECAI